jgi:hypothetical protein
MNQDCYQIITDEKAFKDFIAWLPDHEAHEQYYLALFARKKYAEGDPAVTPKFV